MQIKYLIITMMSLQICLANADPIYLDYQATTPTDQRVVDTMLPYFTKEFGSPHSSACVWWWLGACHSPGNRAYSLCAGLGKAA